MARSIKGTRNQKHGHTHRTKNTNAHTELFISLYFFFGKYDTFFYIKFLYITFFISYNPFIIFFAVSAVKEILYIIKIKINI
jgi:hypothetical protein